ncbi:Putative Zn-dependent protease, contains TPR repeats [Sphingobium sp. AP50]|nr:Putative Zn-dependent protease, contains TPR repeats [Sphingobium sp. AP50]
MMQRAAGLVAIAAALMASAAIGQSKIAPPPPPYAGAYQPQGVDEIGLWREGDENERILANSPILLRDEALNAYVKGVLCATVGDDRCRSVRLYILRVPLFNASMAPNGTMRVYSGLLLRVRNEAELATVLGHEFGHFEQRHTLADWKARRSSTDLLSWAAVLALLGNTYQSYSSFDSLQLSVYGRLSHFNRDQEREADALGLGYLNHSSLRPQSASVVWQNLMAEQEASALVKGVRKRDFNKVAFFASHPPSGERAATLAAFADPAGAERDEGVARYAAALAPWLPTFLDDQIKLNDFGASDFIILSLAQNGWTAQLLVARGDLYRARGNPRDLAQAAEFYGKAVEMDAGLPEAQRGLGLSLFKTGRRTEGQAALRRYLELKPNASDAAMINMLAPAAGGQ